MRALKFWFQWYCAATLAVLLFGVLSMAAERFAPGLPGTAHLMDIGKFIAVFIFGWAACIWCKFEGPDD